MLQGINTPFARKEQKNAWTYKVTEWMNFFFYKDNETSTWNALGGRLKLKTATHARR